LFKNFRHFKHVLKLPQDAINSMIVITKHAQESIHRREKETPRKIPRRIQKEIYTKNWKWWNNGLYLKNNYYLVNPWLFIMLIVVVDFIPGIFLILLLIISEISLYVGAAILQIIS